MPPDPAGIDRRGFLQLGGLAGLGWLTPVGELLAVQAERGREPARSVILLWLAGGPSQLETFDPHPDQRIAGGTRAIATAAPGIQLAEGFGQLAEVMDRVCARPVAREQGGGPRARDLPHEDRLSPRPDRRAPVDRRDLLPRARRRRHRDPPPRLDPARPVAGAGGSPGWRVRRLPDRRPRPPGPRRHQPGARAPRRPAAGRPRSRRAGVRPGAARPRRGHPPPRHLRPRPDHDDLGPAQGVRPVSRAGQRPPRIRRHPLRPRLPGGAAPDRGGRPVRRGDARRLGQPRQQPRESTASGSTTSTPPSPP